MLLLKAHTRHNAEDRDAREEDNNGWKVIGRNSSMKEQEVACDQIHERPDDVNGR